MTTAFKIYEPTPEAIEQARKIGLIGGVPDRLRKMARLAVPFTHPEGNRRYQGYLLTIDGGQIVAIKKFSALARPEKPVNYPAQTSEPEVALLKPKAKPQPKHHQHHHHQQHQPQKLPIFPDAISCTVCEGTKRMTTWDECEDCEGEGLLPGVGPCKTCGGEGSKKVTRACNFARDPKAGICARE